MKCYIMLAEGFEEIEAVCVYDILKRASIDTFFVSVYGEKAVKSSRGMKIMPDMSLSEISSVESDDVVVLPGGMPGTLNLKRSDELAKILAHHYDENGVIAAICAAPSILGEMELLKGKRATCYPGFEESLKGAEFVEKAVVHDGNIITSRGAGTAIQFALEIVSLVKSRQEAEKISSAILL